MELNREQTIKALECCTDENKKCIDCPRFGFIPCTKPLLTDALALIKELTEEVDKFRGLLQLARGNINFMLFDYKGVGKKQIQADLLEIVEYLAKTEDAK